MPVREGIYGLLAEFDTPTELVVAAKTAYDAGWRRMDCYTPYPVEEAAEAIGFHRNYVPLDLPGRRARGVGRHVPHGDLGVGPRLPVEHRRAAVVFLAGLYYPRL